ncbi:TolC family protein [Ferruginibacter albus]|uniref:TolC family protein n=1 Tax=Ferruginibacter albus TaxID=2875540 RepID=UPI001CC6F7AF|nr:TolC family protein [Ferruginibacter albus]UAY52186.1 TolC family protein [Ferruginibacter albus]
MRRKLLLNLTTLFTLIITATTVTAQTKNEFSVKQAVDYGLKNSIQVKNALLDIKNQQQVNREVTSAAFPQISASAGLTHYYDIPVQPIPDFISPQFYNILTKNGVQNGNGQPITDPNHGVYPDLAFSFTLPWTSNIGVTLNQILFDGQVFVGLQAKNTVLNSFKKQAEVTQEQIKANVYKVYYQLVVAKKQQASIQANIDNISKQLNDTKEIYKNGFAEKLDVDKITVQLNNLQTQKEKIENQVSAGNAALKMLIGMPQKEELILTDTLNEDELKQNILDESYNYEDRKEFQLLSITTKMSQYNVKRYQLSKIPTLSGVASYGKNAFGTDFDFYKGTWYTSSYVGVNLKIPIFTGFNTNSKIQEAKIAVEKSKNSLEQLKQSIDNDVVQSRENMKTALATIDNQKQNIQLAESVFKSTQLKYAQGLGSNQEMYDAQTQLEIAQNNYYSSLYDAIVAKISYLQAVGKL